METDCAQPKQAEYLIAHRIPQTVEKLSQRGEEEHPTDVKNGRLLIFSSSTKRRIISLSCGVGGTTSA